MEMEPTQPAIARKLWNIVRVVFFMLKKGMSKSKLMLDLHMLLKRGKLAGKALSNLMFHHRYSAMSCRSDADLSFVSPKEYEFSCSNTPLYPVFNSRRKNNHYHHHHYYNRRSNNDAKLAQNIFDLLKKYETPVEASPLALPGFGKSPMVRQLRITDSPFPLKEAEDQDGEVDKLAEEFIKKMYKELKNQNKIAALQSPSPYPMWAS